MNIISVAGTALLGCAAALIIKRLDVTAGMLTGMMCSIVICVFCIRRFEAFTDFANELESFGGYGEYFSVMMKGLSVSFLCECACDICRDCGENSIASKVEFAGKVELLLLALPLLRSVVEMSKELMVS